MFSRGRALLAADSNMLLVARHSPIHVYWQRVGEYISAANLTDVSEGVLLKLYGSDDLGQGQTEAEEGRGSFLCDDYIGNGASASVSQRISVYVSAKRYFHLPNRRSFGPVSVRHFPDDPSGCVWVGWWFWCISLVEVD